MMGKGGGGGWARPRKIWAHLANVDHHQVGVLHCDVASSMMDVYGKIILHSVLSGSMMYMYDPMPGPGRVEGE